MTTDQPLKADAIAQVRLAPLNAGDRQTPIPAILYRCPVFFGDPQQEANDCAFFFEEIGVTVEPGGPGVTVPIKFFVRELVGDKLRPGARLILWAGRAIGEAEIIEVK